MSLPPDWIALMARLDETIFFGTSNRPLPPELRDLAKDWNVKLSGDDAEAALELLTYASLLSEGTCFLPASLPDTEEVRPLPSRDWTKEQIESITRMLHFPLAPGWRETAWLLRKKGWQWPEESLTAVFNLVQQQPEVWAEIRDLWPPLAPWLTSQFNTRHLFFPSDPPSRNKLSPGTWVSFLFRWIHLDPTGALDWLLIQHPAIPPDIWQPWIERYGCDLPHAVLPLLIILTPEEHALPWLQARVRNDCVQTGISPKISLFRSGFLFASFGVE
ncbi:MAG: hypothetical protein IPJ06_16985 [Saprospiraceae bacterium]|nr:hypothetical protein [Saprospiraceae bacterium]